MRSWPGKIVLFLFSAAFGYAGYGLLDTSFLLYKDKETYENRQFERITGVPDHVEYDNHDTGPRFISDLDFSGQIIDVHYLQITQDYYEANLSGKTLDIQYLPHSHFAVNVDVHGD
ncbi:hypothetical protein [Peribacillus deserti]|uniref:hypothetical protein n=1 Tax=Peribacillus deserti TaxID=673318 RepID=UPI003672176D